jgi:hypothetical protein
LHWPGRLSERIILHLIDLGIINIDIDGMWFLPWRSSVSVIGGSDSSPMTSSGGIGFLAMATGERRSNGQRFFWPYRRTNDQRNAHYGVASNLLET